MLPPSPIHLRRGYLVNTDSHIKVEYFEIKMVDIYEKDVILYREIDKNGKPKKPEYYTLNSWSLHKITKSEKDIKKIKKAIIENKINFWKEEMEDARKHLEELNEKQNPKNTKASRTKASR